jgi:PAS domain S-box-containing protein
MRAALPHDETKRLEALIGASILDTGVEQFFEDIVDSVQQVVVAPIVLVSLVDEHRQWFKARRGIEAPETPRDHAFCAHAILNPVSLVIGDARLDARFRTNPLVTGEPYLVAYAGAPIALESGVRIGTVCAIDHIPRQWSGLEILHLERNARLVARHIDARCAHIERDRHRFLELALARAETRYKSVIESVSEGVVLHGPSGAIVDSNAAASAILGLSEDELFGRVSPDPRWRALRANGEAFPGDEHPAMVTLRTGDAQYGIVMGIETPAGERRWISVSSHPIRRPGDGRVDQVLAVFRMVRNEPTGPAN